MNAAQLRAWRKTNGWGQAELAKKLGLQRRMIQYYERGERDGKPIAIPRAVGLACYAIACGVVDFDGRGVQWTFEEPARKPERVEDGSETEPA
ncbi:helix-turn-helix domain-containing protein [Acuticoccus kandeliae]|uniref:helix-turn-helix domain-containing protein n=1 Tax=Acuticoccus kandeliae TaxID=2073160 RepID=UPI000D3E1B3F|nr:helix-turn-helix transcriptional regulator [Acuticoccus kandeliae]